MEYQTEPVGTNPAGSLLFFEDAKATDNEFSQK
ncbi:hypothetical protein JOC47_001920 [Halanaerobacter jeridensis]|uniref:Uncharacterized protein n=1 Tax=Halanaerobacter jeridensis TaxID=706427 RepID=A0A938XVH7_9FIRM|nr:hypothetical protein [Halanaerobacter jeridensis]